MSRRPISSQGRSKPDVKSYPARPSSSTFTRQKKSTKEGKIVEKDDKEMERRLEAMKLKEEEYRRENEKPSNKFPMIEQECDALLANFKYSDQELDEEMRKAALPADREILDGDDLESIEARERTLRRMNEELNEKNSGFVDQCSAILSKFDPNLAKELTEIMAIKPREQDAPPQHRMEPDRTDQMGAEEAEFRRINDELERENAEITKQAEAMLGIQLGDRAPPAKKTNKKPPAPQAGIKKSQSAKQVKQLLDNIELAERSRSHSQLDDRTEEAGAADSLPELREDLISADFSEVVRRIEARMGDETSSDQVDLATKDSREIREASEKMVTARPATAPAPAPKAALVRARGPIDDIEPPEEVGAEAIQRFLKAKLRVLQEELDRASEEIAQKDAELQQCKKELSGKQEQSSQLDRQVTSLRTQSEKQLKRLELATRDLDNSKIEIAGLKRELESQQRNQKKVDNTQSAVEVRLNRALEEVEKYKLVVQQMKGDSKDSHTSTSKRLEGLQVENKMLFKQREELMAGFKKQMKLIDNLKRQKMHMEAAKMLAFSEEEFMRVLDWWKVSD